MTDRLPLPEREVLVAPPRAGWLASYAAALERGWSPSNLHDISGMQLAALRADPAVFLASLIDPKGRITLPDGTTRERVPSMLRWMWDGEFCGAITLRWQRGTDALPDHVLGHIGYAVVPWKRGRGYATAALAHMLGEAKRLGLVRLSITTDPGNLASCRVIEKNGGRLVREFVNPVYGPDRRLLYEVALSEAA